MGQPQPGIIAEAKENAFFVICRDDLLTRTIERRPFLGIQPPDARQNLAAGAGLR